MVILLCSVCREPYVYVWKKLVEKKTPHRTLLLANNNYKVRIHKHYLGFTMKLIEPQHVISNNVAFWQV